MAKIKDNQIILCDEEGKENITEVLFTYENEERGKKYVFFIDPNDDENVIAMSYTDDGGLDPIEDDEEYEEVEEVFNAYQDDPKIAEIK